MDEQGIDRQQDIIITALAKIVNAKSEPAKPVPSEGDWEVRSIGSSTGLQNRIFYGVNHFEFFKTNEISIEAWLLRKVCDSRNSDVAALRAEVEELRNTTSAQVTKLLSQKGDRDVKIKDLTEQLGAAKAEDHQWYIENTTGGDRRVVHSKTQEIYHLRIGKADSPEDAARFVAEHNEPSKPLPDGRPKHKPKGWREAMLSTRLSLWTILEHDGEGNMRHVSCGINDHTARKEASDHNKSRGFSD